MSKTPLMAQHQHNPKLLLNWTFISALLVLLLNDHLWKWTHANSLTGKLSDVSGLVLLPLLLVFLFPRLRVNSIWISALFFILWKTPLVDPLIEIYNRWALIPISRVVDYTDYWALLILPLPYWLLHRLQQPAKLSAPREKRYHWRPLFAWSMGLITALAFMATSMPRWYYFQQSTGNVRFHDCRYKTGKTADEVLQILSQAGIDAELDTALAQRTYVRYWEANDSNSVQLPPFYRIPQLVVAEDTLRDIQFALMPAAEGEVMFMLNGLQVDSLETEQIDQKLRRMYRKLLKKNVVRKVR